MAPERLAGLNARLRGVRLGNFEFCAEGLWLGAAQGNRFEITLREVQCPQVCALHPLGAFVAVGCGVALSRQGLMLRDGLMVPGLLLHAAC